jgi:hypothetical protein
VRSRLSHLAHRVCALSLVKPASAAASRASKTLTWIKNPTSLLRHCGLVRTASETSAPGPAYEPRPEPPPPVAWSSGRRAREAKTLAAMLQCFCQAHHHRTTAGRLRSVAVRKKGRNRGWFSSAPVPNCGSALPQSGDRVSSPATGLCPDCQALMNYALLRLERCRFGADKPTCARCPVHCYQAHRRGQIQQIMRFSGPRMLWQHPLLSLQHWFDSLRHPRLA